MPDVAIEVKELSKKYTIRSKKRSAYKSLRESITRKVSSWFSLSPHRSEESQPIWALKDVSFTIEQGEVVGIIGPNGAGKTTILKILSRITPPTTGHALVKGNIGSLLEVGTGFHQELTGRENVYFNGAVLGMTSSEIDNKFEDIVEFAGVETFVDTPIKHYSAGMKVRLAFSVAAHLETEILLVDEVLAVGDAEFQKRCLGKMNDIAEKGRTVLFVSHDMGAINELCSRTMLLKNGKIEIDGPTKKVVSSYLTENSSESPERTWSDGISDPGIHSFKLQAVRVKDSSNQIKNTIPADEPFWIELEFSATRKLPFCRVGFLLTTPEGHPVFESYDSDQPPNEGRLTPGLYQSQCKVPAKFLNVGEYLLTLHMDMPEQKVFFHKEGVFKIEIEEIGAVGSNIRKERQGLIRPQLEWTRTKLEEEVDVS